MPQFRRIPAFLRAAGVGVVIALASGLTLAAAQSAEAASTSPCVDGTTPDPLSTVSCNSAGAYTLTVPPGVTSVDVDVVGGGGGAGYPARQHIGGHAASTTGTVTLPAGTEYLHVIVGAAGTGNNNGTGTGGGASAVFAQDASHALIAKLAIAAGGGGGSYNGDGGNAGLPGTSENVTFAAPGQAGSGATGGAGGIGNYNSGSAGGNDSPTASTVAAGGAGGLYPNGSRGGGGGGGYAGGGGGGAGSQGILNVYTGGGGGGSSFASSYLGNASITVVPGTGGIQLPGLVAGDGATGTVTLTFDGVPAPTVPGVPTGVAATFGDGQAVVSFAAPASDGGSAITGYTVTSTPGGITAGCAGSPCVITGLSNGTAYTFTVHASNTVGDSLESAPSVAVTPAAVPGVPTGVAATFGDGQAVVSFAAPASDGGSAITGYTVTSTPGGITAGCAGSPCVITGLSNGTAYTFTVHASNTVGDSAESLATASGIPRAPATAPAAPSGLRVVATDTSLTVSFTAPDDGGAPITGYQISLDGGVTWASLATTTTAATVTGTVTGLDPSTRYSVEVRAVNAVGVGAGNATPSVAVTTSSNATPSNPVATRPASLASTGANPMPLLALACLVLFAGIVTTRVGRGVRG